MVSGNFQGIKEKEGRLSEKGDGVYGKIKTVLNLFRYESSVEEILAQLSEILKGSVLVINSEGKVLYSKIHSSCHEFSPQRNDYISVYSLLLNAFTYKMENCPFTDGSCPFSSAKWVKVLPLYGRDRLIGHLVIVSLKPLPKKYSSLLAEVLTILFPYFLYHVMEPNREERVYNKDRLKMALESLTYTERRIILDILQKSNRENDRINIKINSIAASYGVSSSVINRGLKKLESAGVIEHRSLSLKGSVIKIINPFLLENLDVLAKEVLG